MLSLAYILDICWLGPLSCMWIYWIREVTSNETVANVISHPGNTFWNTSKMKNDVFSCLDLIDNKILEDLVSFDEKIIIYPPWQGAPDFSQHRFLVSISLIIYFIEQFLCSRCSIHRCFRGLASSLLYKLNMMSIPCGNQRGSKSNTSPLSITTDLGEDT